MDEVVALFDKCSCAKMLRFNCKILGLVVSGRRFIYDSENRVEVSAGSMFLLTEGIHFVEDVPNSDYEGVEIIEIEITPSLLQDATISLINDYGVDSLCPFKSRAAMRRNFAIAKPTNELKVLLEVAVRNFGNMASTLRISELLYNLIVGGYNSFCSLMFANCDMRRARFVSHIYGNLLNHNTIDSMATQRSCSAATFKNEFRRTFDSSPHKWYLNQRMRLAHTLLLTTNLQICQISDICKFSNTSHFIRLFRQHYNTTPRLYRLRKL